MTRKHPVTTVVLITPQMAMELLKRNRGNRPLDKKLVAKYAAIMRRGEWRLTHQGIGVGVDECLYDGQHRMHAIIESGVSVEMMVTTDLPEEGRPVMDGGRKRAVWHQLSMLDNIPHPKLVTTCCNATSRLVHGTDYQVVYDEVRRWYYQNSTSILDVEGMVTTRNAANLSSSAVFCALVFAHRKDTQRVSDLIHQLATGEGFTSGDPGLVLREYLVKTNVPSGRAGREVSLRVLRGIQLHLLGRKATKIQHTEEGYRFFLEAHTADTLPVKPPTVRESSPELIDVVKGCGSVDDIVRTLRGSLPKDSEVLDWCLDHRVRFPVLSAVPMSDMAMRVSASLKRAARGEL